MRPRTAVLWEFLAGLLDSRARIRDSLDSYSGLSGRFSGLSGSYSGLSGLFLKLSGSYSGLSGCASGLSAVHPGPWDFGTRSVHVHPMQLLFGTVGSHFLHLVQLIWTFCAYFSLWWHIVTLCSFESTSISSSSTTPHRCLTCARRSCTCTRHAAAGSLCGALGRNPARRRWRQRGISAAAISSDSSAAISSDYSSTNSCNSPSLSFAFTAGRAAILKDFRFFQKIPSLLFVLLPASLWILRFLRRCARVVSRPIGKPASTAANSRFLEFLAIFILSRWQIDNLNLKKK